VLGLTSDDGRTGLAPASYGPLIGRFGLALDNLLAAEVVLADGRIATAMPGGEEELFWALRGGGGNFGVVTEMHVQLHHLPSVRSGMLIYPFAEARAVLEGCAELSASGPDDLTVQVGCLAGPDGAPVVFAVPTWCGEPNDGEARIAPFLKLGTPLVSAVQTTSYRTSLTVFDAHIVNGLQTFMETCWLPVLDGGAIDAVINAMTTTLSSGCAVFTHEFKGAASRVPEQATAFGLRRDHVVVEILATLPDRSDALEEKRLQQWARATRNAFDVTALPGGYPNFLTDEDADRVMRSYGGNAERLIAAKRRYDPGNLFSSAIPLPCLTTIGVQAGSSSTGVMVAQCWLDGARTVRPAGARCRPPPNRPSAPQSCVQRTNRSRRNSRPAPHGGA
jgi:FAD/FMN-containing dehydrogenase